MARSHAAAAVLAVGVLWAGASGAGAQTVYFEDFENEASWPEWSTSVTAEAYPTFTRFLGRFINHRATLDVNLPALPQDNTIPGEGPTWSYVLDFSFYCIDSWDGSDTLHGPDRFQVLVNDEVIFSETFANQHGLQSFRGADVGPVQLGFDTRWMDSIYQISLPFSAPPGMNEISFEAMGLHGSMSDESWGIDNVHVRMALIPAPGAGMAALLGVGVMGARRRR